MRLAFFFSCRDLFERTLEILHIQTDAAKGLKGAVKETLSGVLCNLKIHLPPRESEETLGSKIKGVRRKIDI